jgi:hypothetical protein
VPVKFKVITDDNKMREPTEMELPLIKLWMAEFLWIDDIQDYAVGDYDVPGVGLVLFMEQAGNGKPQ